MSLNKKEEVDTTNWKAWYIALILILLLQIVLYYLITNRFVA